MSGRDGEVNGLMPIGEFSAACQLSVKMLRHYHAAGLLEPALVDPTTGYRYYRWDQVAGAVAIAELRQLDMPLAEIAEVTAAPFDRARELLAAHRERLRGELARTEARLAHIETILRREPTMSYEITETTIPAQRVASKRVSGPNTPESNQALLVSGLTDVWNAITAAGGDESSITGSPVAVVHYGDEERFEQELCVPVAGVTPQGDVSVRELEPVRAAVARHVGEQPNPREVMEWARARGHRVGVPFRVVIVSAPPYFGEGDDMVCDIVVPYYDDAPAATASA